MSHKILFLCPVFVVLLFTQKIDAVDYSVTNTAANTPGGACFNRDIGAQYSQQTLAAATSYIWNTFQQQNSPADRKNVPKVSLFIDDMSGVAFAINNELHVIMLVQGISKVTLGTLRERSLVYYTTKVLTFGSGMEMAQAGLGPSHWVKPGQGDRWDQGCDVTAQFLSYCNSLRNGFVAQLNKKMRNGYSNQFFVDLLGKTVDQLWSDYKAKYCN
ncbi:hypothetical protein H5410_021991 [Solanum commersonii]|uniref:Uncharacterized protein n=1 Tax=Solanum commersonii TaxID=4109 RepID=A0A9J5ZIK1_SOLCO|nr:hypothetical protein H5410_021991 [Solanum commersonii]